MATWVNSDGLPINLGIDESKFTKLAGYATDGDQRFIEVVVEGGHLPAFGNTEVVDYTIVIPEGAVISKVEVAPNAVTFTGTGTLDVGTVDTDGTSNGDVDSIFDGLTVADLNGGTVTLAGALVNAAPLTAPKLITWTVNTAAIEAGTVSLRIFYVIPKKGDQTDTLVYQK